MTALTDFRETLTKDPADWLVLADWLEERGDARGKWVRYVAQESVGHTCASPEEFLCQYSPDDDLGMPLRFLVAVVDWFDAADNAREQTLTSPWFDFDPPKGLILTKSDLPETAEEAWGQTWTCPWFDLILALAHAHATYDNPWVARTKGHNQSDI